MAVEVARGARTRWREGNLVFLFSGSVEAEPDEIAGRVRDRLFRSEPPEGGEPDVAYVSEAVLLPAGFAVAVDAKDAGPRQIDGVVAAVLGELEAAGGVGTLHAPSWPGAVREGPSIVGVALPFGAERGSAPMAWRRDAVDAAVAWVQAEDDLEIMVGPVHLELSAAAASGFATEASVERSERVRLAASDGRVERFAHVEPGDDLDPPLFVAGVVGVEASGVVDELDRLFTEVTVEVLAAASGNTAWVDLSKPASVPSAVAPVPDRHTGDDPITCVAQGLVGVHPWQLLTDAQRDALTAVGPHPLLDLDGQTLKIGPIDEWLGIDAWAPSPWPRQVERALGPAGPHAHDVTPVLPPGIYPPPIQAFARHLAERGGAATPAAEALAAMAPPIATDEPGEAEALRRLFTNWYCRSLVPAMLHAAGLQDHAEAIRSAPTLRERFELEIVLRALWPAARASARLTAPELRHHHDDEAAPSNELTVADAAATAARAAQDEIRRLQSSVAVTYEHSLLWTSRDLDRDALLGGWWLRFERTVYLLLLDTAKTIERHDRRQHNPDRITFAETEITTITERLASTDEDPWSIVEAATAGGDFSNAIEGLHRTGTGHRASAAVAAGQQYLTRWFPAARLDVGLRACLAPAEAIVGQLGHHSPAPLVGSCVAAAHEATSALIHDLSNR